jgi:hypothetical protein
MSLAHTAIDDMDWIYEGAPYVAMAASTAATEDMDWTYEGEPHVIDPETAATGSAHTILLNTCWG